MKTIRLKDLADKASVSITAVSKVLNGRNIRISEEKKNEIKKLAELYNYRPNIIARGLQQRATRTIGIVIPDITTLFYPEMILNIERRVNMHNYNLIICNTSNNSAVERQHIENLLSRQVDGIILAPVAGDNNLNYYKKLIKTLPLVFLDRYHEFSAFNYVVSDNNKSAKAGIAALKNKNPNIDKLIYIGEQKRNAPLADRLKGVIQEAAKQNL